MPAKLELPELEIVNHWLDDVSANSRSLALAYGCGFRTIASIISRHVPREQIALISRKKVSRSTSLRTDIKTDEHKLRLAAMASSQTQDGKQRCRAALKRGTQVSACKRVGQSLSPEHRQKVSLALIGKYGAEKSSNWRGGTSKICWRGAGWYHAKRQALDRDNHVCRFCGKNMAENGREMDVHHRVSFFAFTSIADANALDNLVSLCRSCHHKVEAGSLICP